jgi:CBS domain-containing protein
MICPDCKAENIEGADLCESCGADLRNLKLPGAQTLFEEHLTNDRLGGIVAREAATVSPGDPVAYAVHFMREKETEAVLVTEDSEVVGILTERDILLKAAGEKVDLNAMAVRDIMTPDPVILREDDTLAVALHKMSIGGFRHIPFVAEGRPVQMVSIQDVFRHVSSVVHLAGTTL